MHTDMTSEDYNEVYEAHDALEDGNHNKYGDMPLEGKNKESQNDLGIETGIEPRNENHVDHGDYAYTDIEGENEHVKTLIITKN